MRKIRKQDPERDEWQLEQENDNWIDRLVLRPSGWIMWIGGWTIIAILASWIGK